MDGDWISKITGHLASAEKEVSNDFKSVKEVELVSANKGDYTTAKWARARAKTIAEEKVLTFLSRKAIIPKYGFPVDVVELDTQRTQKTQESFEVSLQRDLSIAIAEFAPTSRLIANKKEWTSYGIKKVPEKKKWDRRYYKRCLRHNAFLQWRIGEAEPADPCEDKLLVNEYIIPRFGFVTSREPPKEPKYRPPKMFTTRPYFEGLLGPDPGKISFSSDKSLLLTIQKASPGRMVVLCEGRRGEGFYICGECGAGPKQRGKKHKNQYGQDCSGMLKQVSLGHEFETDVVQIHFHLQPETDLEPLWFTYSLAYALVEGAAEFLEIPSSDLNATVRYSQKNQVPPIVLYDNVPGGAGLVARLEQEEVLKECFRTAQKRVSGQCGCSATESCYGCLRSYRNQFVHQHLQRGPVTRYLEKMLSVW